MNRSATQPNHQRSKKWLWLHRFSSPAYAYNFCTRWGKIFGGISVLLILVGCYLGLFVAPADYQMGDSYRIMFVHVPSAWMSMFCYVVLATSAFVGLVWQIKMGHVVAQCCAPIGAMFTFFALVTGALWGKPTWGTYWIWDARLTSELILLFLYFGYMALVSAIDDKYNAPRAGALLAIVGLINIPIIHFSVDWWNTLHQGASIMKLDTPSIHSTMRIPLLFMFIAVNFYFVANLCSRIRTHLLESEQNTQWVKTMVKNA